MDEPIADDLLLRLRRFHDDTFPGVQDQFQSLVSWLGSESPFLFVWIFNTIDAIILSWCAILRKDRAYSLLNSFWILVGVVGILRATGVI